MRQCTLFEFSRIGIGPAEGWMHEHTDGRAWIYRTNAEAVVRDMGGLPSGAGLWPRIMPTRKTGSWKEWDLHVWQCRGSGPFTKLIRTDGTTFDEFRPYRVEYVNGKSTERSDVRLEAVSAYIDGDLLITETREGGQWSVDIVEDTVCDPRDIHRFDPANDPEHYLILAMSKGLRGDAVMKMADLPCSFSIISPWHHGMDEVWASVPLTGVVPRMSYDVHHITESLDIAPIDKTCDRCLKRRPNGGCQSGCEHDNRGICWRSFYWNGKPFPKRSKTRVRDDCFDEEGCEA